MEDCFSLAWLFTLDKAVAARELSRLFLFPPKAALLKKIPKAVAIEETIYSNSPPKK